MKQEAIIILTDLDKWCKASPKRLRERFNFSDSVLVIYVHCDKQIRCYFAFVSQRLQSVFLYKHFNSFSRVTL